jgi:hypothetical protein
VSFAQRSAKLFDEGASRRQIGKATTGRLLSARRRATHFTDNILRAGLNYQLGDVDRDPMRLSQR